jgi:hypothetical protein
LSEKLQTSYAHDYCIGGLKRLCLSGSALVLSLKADESNKETIITIDHQVAVRGTILPPGRYTLKVRDSSGQTVVCIFDGEGRRLITTAFANRAYRLDAADNDGFDFPEARRKGAA